MRFAAVAIALVALHARAAHADATRALADARAHFAGLDFELVLTDTDAVAKDPSASAAQLADAQFLRGSTLVVLDREPDAAAAFESLLALAPAFRAPTDTPPRIRAAFEAARAAHAVHVEEQLATEHGAELHAVKLAVAGPAAARGGRAAAWTVTLVDPAHLVDRVLLGYRRETDRVYNLVDAAPAARLTLALPGGAPAADRAYRLAYYVEAIHGGAAHVRTAGSPDAPLWLDVAAGRPPGPVPVTHRWWFWTGVATLAIAVPLLVDHYRDVGGEHVVITR